MSVDFTLLLMIVLATMVGAMLGTVSGLIPGIHVNTLALALLALEGSLSSLLGGVLRDIGLGTESLPLVICSVIVSAAVVHSFLDFIPSIFLGAPDSSDALSVLPGHRMLMSGRGLEAVHCSARGSLVGTLVAILLAVPSQLLMGSPIGLYTALSPAIPFILSGVVVMLLISERHGGRRAVAWAMAMILASGLLGYLVFNFSLPLRGMEGLGQSLLFPLLTGLFGIPTLLLSLGNRSMPPQTEMMGAKVPLLSSMRGVVAGSLVGWFPGITSTSGAVIASMFSREIRDSPPSFITTVSAVGSSAAVFSLIALAVTGKGRTGAMLVVVEIMGDDLSLLGRLPSGSFAMLLLSVLLAGFLGYILSLHAGRAFSRMVSVWDMGKVVKSIIVLVMALVLVFNGVQGLLLLTVATLLGLVPPRVGVGRVHLTGCLMVPVILFFCLG